MADFPSSPSNGDTHIIGNTIWVYNSGVDSWLIQDVNEYAVANLQNTPHANPGEGTLWYDSQTTGRLFIFINGAWIDASPGDNSNIVGGNDITVTQASNQYTIDVDDSFVRNTGDTMTGNLNFGDNDKAIFGAGSDLEIFHNGTTSYIRDVGNGDLQLFATDDVYIRGYATNNYMARFNENGAVTLYHNNSAKLATASTGISVTGNVSATGDVIAFASDNRLKNIEGRVENALDIVDNLNGYYYRFNELAGEFDYDTESRLVGVSAQEVEAVLPEVVKSAPINSGNDTDYKTVQYEKLVPVLIEAIKELRAEIETLKGK